MQWAISEIQSQHNKHYKWFLMFFQFIDIPFIFYLIRKVQVTAFDVFMCI